VTDLTHHPDCAWHHDHDDRSCQCGLTAPAIGHLKPWTREAMEAWRAKVTAEWKAIEQRGKP
jgi:hypothetical protein